MNGEINLKHFLAKGYVTKRDRILTFIIPFYGIIIAHRIFSDFEKQKPNAPTTIKCTKINIYRGENPTAKKIQSQLQTTPHDAILAALVHGSIGDLNEIEFSDFDGILLIDTSKIQHALQLHELRQLIKKTESLFLNQDALQHHGWAIFTNAELLQFSDHLFPLDIIIKSKCLFPNEEYVLKAQVFSENEQYKILLKHLCASILRKTNHLNTLKNQYIFKNLLSEIMLLPSAFLQAKNYKSIEKRHSFSTLKKEFSEIDAEILDWSSEIRLNWKQEKLTFKTKLFHRFKDAGILISYLAPKTPETIIHQLNDSWRLRVVKLCENLLKNAA
jgi:hypothetical protein